MCWGWTHGGEVSQQLISHLDCIAEQILGRTDVTPAGVDSSGSMSTGWTDVTSACGNDHLTGSNFTVVTRLIDITLVLLGTSPPDERHQCFIVLLRFCQGLVMR